MARLRSLGVVAISVGLSVLSCGRTSRNDGVARDLCGTLVHCAAGAVAPVVSMRPSAGATSMGGVPSGGTSGVTSGGDAGEAGAVASGGAGLGGDGTAGVSGDGAAGLGGDGAAGQAGAGDGAWGVETSISHEQHLGISGGSVFTSTVAVAGDDSAFTVWKAGQHPHWGVYVSRYEPGGDWSEPVELDADSGSYDGVAVAAEGNGDALAVWQHAGALGYAQVMAARYHGGWQPPLALGELGRTVQQLSLKANSRGDYLVSWEQAPMGPGPVRMELAHYTSAGGWEPTLQPVCAPEADEKVQTVAGMTNLSLSASGFGLVTWASADWTLPAFDTYLLAARYSPGSGFSECETILVESASSGAFPYQALDEAGHGLVSWVAGEPGSLALKASTFDAAWGPPAVLDADTATHRLDQFEAVASDGAGHFVVVWNANDSGQAQVFGSSSLQGKTWSLPVPLDASDAAAPYQAHYPVLSMSVSGTAHVAWVRSPLNSNTASSVVASSFDFEGGFAKPSLVSDVAASDQLAILSDPRGNGMLFWRAGQPAQLLASRYRKGTGWQVPQDLQQPGHDGIFQRMAVGDSGEVVAVWLGSYPFTVSGAVFR